MIAWLAPDMRMRVVVGVDDVAVPMGPRGHRVEVDARGLQLLDATGMLPAAFGLVRTVAARRWRRPRLHSRASARAGRARYASMPRV
jgi:hypothetical protein